MSIGKIVAAKARKKARLEEEAKKASAKKAKAAKKIKKAE